MKVSDAEGKVLGRVATEAIVDALARDDFSFHDYHRRILRSPLGQALTVIAVTATSTRSPTSRKSGEVSPKRRRAAARSTARLPCQ